MKLKITLLLLFLLFVSGCLDHEVKILGSDGNPLTDVNAKQIISDALNNTDKNVTELIGSVTVSDIDTVTGVCKGKNIQLSGKYYVKNLGCNDLTYNEDNSLLSSNIYIVYNGSDYDKTCSDFKNVVYHEIGHAVYAYEYGYNAENSEYHANAYANNRSKDKCHTDEYLALEQKLQEKEDIYNNTLTTLSRWGGYSAVPEDMFIDYVKDYRTYENALVDYNIATKELNTYLGLKTNMSNLDLYKNKCTAEKFDRLLDVLINSKNHLSETTEQLKVWDRWGYGIPSEYYDKYLYDYDEYQQAYSSYTLNVNTIQECLT